MADTTLRPIAHGLPRERHSLIYDAVCRTFAGDPVLRRAGCKFVLHRGDDGGAPIQPTTADLPLIEVRPRSSAWKWDGEGVIDAPLLLDVEIAVAGRDARVLMDLWAAVCRVFFPLDQDRFDQVGARMNSAGALNLLVSQPAYDLTNAGGADEDPFMVASGSMEIPAFVYTSSLTQE